MERELPASMKQTIAKKHIRFYNMDAVKLAREVGMGNRINTIMQAASQQMYQQAGPQQAGPQPGAGQQAGQQGGQNTDDNIQDADFEEVK